MGSDTPTKVGILSMGDMGAGLARLLVAHGFSVATNIEGRSSDTIKRAHKAGVEGLSSDVALVQQCDVILSVVPPRDAESIARRIIDALADATREGPLYFADLNAVSPSASKRLDTLLQGAKAPLRFIDGCIVGGPPRPKSDADPGTNVSVNGVGDSDWSRPRIPISGPWSLSALPDGDRLASVLNMRTISSDIGAASGLKMCFAAMSKGFTALATQSFATAHQLGVADDLKLEMSQILPTHLAMVEKSVTGMPPKAYRWVHEMEEIAATMSENGGWGKELFDGVADVYRVVAANEVLGQEKIGKRSRGTTVEDVAEVLADGLAKKRKRTG